MLGLELYQDAIPLRDKALRQGVLLNVTNQTVIRLLPALTFTKEDIDELTYTLESLLMNP